MSNRETGADYATRWVLSAIGALAGLGFYLLAEFHAELGEMVAIGAGAFLFSFSYLIMVCQGPLRLGASALYAGVSALIAAGLLMLGAARFDPPSKFGDSALLPVFVVMVLLWAPYVIAHARGRMGQGAGLTDYAQLFNESWAIVVRVVSALVFLGLFWVLLMLSNALLELVGLTIIEDILEFDAVPFVLSGGVFGLALGVIYEMRGFVTPYLPLRLLRLLILPVLVVVAIFVLALPLTGMEGLVRGLSVTGTLLAIGAVIATLVTTAADVDASEEIHGDLSRRAAQILAVLLLPVAALALYGIAQRVMQYGWTPERIAAAVASVIALGYGGFYAVSALRGGDWMARVRWANARLALVFLAVCALWLSPVLNAQRISAKDQFARYMSGDLEAANLPLHQLKYQWGIAGSEVFAALSALEGEKHAALRNSLENWDARRVSKTDAERLTDITSVLVSLPERGAVTPEELAHVKSYQYGMLETACDTQTPGGNPGCFAARLADGQAAHVVVILRTPRGLMVMTDEGGLSGVGDLAEDVAQADDLIDRAFAGELTIAPRQVLSVQVGEEIVFTSR